MGLQESLEAKAFLIPSSLSLSANYKQIITLEDGVEKGGFGSAIMEFAQENNYKIKIEIVGVPHKFIPHGDTEVLYESVEFSSIKILKKIENILSIINKV